AGGRPADRPIGEDRARERNAKSKRRDEYRENRRHLERREVLLVAEQVLEILEPDELRTGAERILDEERLVYRLRRRPEKEDQRDRHLRRDERVRQPARLEAGALFHVSDGARCRGGEVKSPPPPQGSTALVCFVEALDDLVAAL